MSNKITLKETMMALLSIFPYAAEEAARLEHAARRDSEDLGQGLASTRVSDVQCLLYRYFIEQVSCNIPGLPPDWILLARHGGAAEKEQAIIRCIDEHGVERQYAELLVEMVQTAYAAEGETA